MVSGKEGAVDSKNANNCNVLLVVDKGIGIRGVQGVACFKIADNQNEFVNCE